MGLVSRSGAANRKRIQQHSSQSARIRSSDIRLALPQPIQQLEQIVDD
jgi:hypothetical protein